MSLTLSRPAPLRTYPANEIPWGEIQPLVREALSRGNGDWWPEDVLEKLVTEEAQLWVWGNFQAIAVTTIKQTRLKTCLIWLCAGEGMDEWKWVINEIEKWAASIGCDRMEVNGRRGWVKALGWPEMSVNAGKPICR